MGILERQVQLRFISADSETLLNKLTDAGVILLNVSYIGSLTVEISINKRQYAIVRRILENNGTDIKTTKETGLSILVQRFLKRPVLVCGIVVFFLASYIIQNRIYFVKVTGNMMIPDRMILSVAEDAGIRFGCKAKSIRSEEIKNRMLTALPNMQWVGVNTYGCVAIIHVQERTRPEKNSEFTTGISNIVAKRDGTVTGITVQSGTPLIVMGQSVKEGDILVSGYTDYGLKVIGQNAQAEIMAHTVRDSNFITTAPILRQGEGVLKHVCHRMRIGKKVINFCNHSGISDAVCVKMYSEDYWTLPGGFQLPVSIQRIEHRYYAHTEQSPEPADVEQWLPVYARKYLQSQMIAGQILDEDLIWTCSDGYCQLSGVYACHEMIGQVKYEEIIEHNAEDN